MQSILNPNAIYMQSICNPDAIHMPSRWNPYAIHMQSICNLRNFNFANYGQRSIIFVAFFQKKIYMNNLNNSIKKEYLPADLTTSISLW